MCQNTTAWWVLATTKFQYVLHIIASCKILFSCGKLFTSGKKKASELALQFHSNAYL